MSSLSNKISLLFGAVLFMMLFWHVNSVLAWGPPCSCTPRKITSLSCNYTLRETNRTGYKEVELVRNEMCGCGGTTGADKTNMCLWSKNGTIELFDYSENRTTNPTGLKWNLYPGDTLKITNFSDSWRYDFIGNACGGDDSLVRCSSYTSGLISGPPAPNPSGSLTANASCDGTTSAKMSLSWNISNASSCYLFREGRTTSLASGCNSSITDRSLSLNTNYTYYITTTDSSSAARVAQDSDRTPSSCTTPPPGPSMSVTFGASPTSISSGQSATLSWSTSNVPANGTCYAWANPYNANWDTNISSPNRNDLKNRSGSKSVNLTQTTTFTLSCSDGSNNSITRNVTVNVSSAPPPPIPPTVDIRANNSNGPISVLYGSSANLSWTTTNANSCTASGSWSGSKSTSGSQSTGSLTASSYTYTLTCANSSSGLSASDSVVVNTTNNNPTGSFTSVSCDTGQIVVTGSASDPDGGGPVQLRIYLDYPGGLVTQTVNNNPAVNRFTFSYPRNVGTHNTRVYARDNQKGAWVQIGGQLSYACYEPIAITDPCPECGEPQINFTFDAVPGVCS